jgi:hypothetical protein
MRSMTVVITLKIEERHFQISGRPEEHAVETFAPNGACRWRILDCAADTLKKNLR